jgi:hypothetical protein
MTTNEVFEGLVWFAEDGEQFRLGLRSEERVDVVFFSLIHDHSGINRGTHVEFHLNLHLQSTS